MGVAEAGSMLVVTQDSLVFEDRENRSERESPGGHPGLFASGGGFKLQLMRLPLQRLPLVSASTRRQLRG
jgi:hypothetical protein